MKQFPDQQKPSTVQLLKRMLTFTIPLILSSLLQQIFNWVDALIVGNLINEMALAGVGATTSLYNLFVTVIVGFTSGLSVLTAQQYGSGRKHEIRYILRDFVWILGIMFLVISIQGAFLTSRILHLMDTPDNILGYAQHYLTFLWAGIPFLAVYNVYSAVLRAVGNSKASFIAVLISSVVNAGLDLLFVAVLGMDTDGAAIATAMSQAAMTVFIIVYTHSKYPFLVSSLRDPELFHAFQKGIKYGFPPALQSGVISFGNLYLQRFMNHLGEKTVAAITTSYRVDSVLLLPVINFSTGISTLVAQDAGAGNREEAKRILRLGIVTMALISAFMTVAIFLFGDKLIAIFGLGPASVATGKTFFRCLASFYTVYGIAMAFRGYLEGNADLVFSSITGIASLAVRIICSYAFERVFGNMVIAFAEGFSWVFLLIIYFVRYEYKENANHCWG